MMKKGNVILILLGIVLFFAIGCCKDEKCKDEKEKVDSIALNKAELILDAGEAGRPPGEVVVWHGEDVPYFFTSKMSVHQVSFAEILNLAKFNNAYPAHIAVVGIQPHTLDWGTELSHPVRQALPQAIRCVQEILETWALISP